MLKNIFKYAVIGSLVLNPLISKAEPHRADRMSANQEQEIIRADVRTEAGKQDLFNFFTSLSLVEQREYLHNSEQSNKELRKKIEQTQMELDVLDAKRRMHLAAHLVPTVWMYVFVVPSLLIHHKYAARQISEINVFKKMNPKFLKGGVIFSAVMIGVFANYLGEAGVKQASVFEADLEKISNIMNQMKEELNYEKEMIEVLKAYHESNK